MIHRTGPRTCGAVTPPARVGVTLPNSRGSACARGPISLRKVPRNTRFQSSAVVRAIGGGWHKVEPGEHLYSIARHHGVTFTALKNANEEILAAAPGGLKPGQVLTIPVLPLPTTSATLRADAPVPGAAKGPTAAAVTAAPPPRFEDGGGGGGKVGGFTLFAWPTLAGVALCGAALRLRHMRQRSRNPYEEFLREAQADVNFQAEKDGELEVTIQRAEELRVGLLRWNSDPYVTVALGGYEVRGQRSLGTGRLKDPTHPVWNQRFILPVPNRPAAGAVRITVRDHRSSGLSTLGTGEFELDGIESDEEPVPIQIPLRRRLPWPGPGGQVNAEVAYKTTAQGRRERVEIESVREWWS